MEDEARRQRAEARRQRMVILKTSLDSDADACPIRGAEAISLLTQLTRRSWALAGRPIPSYTRAEIPVRFVPRR